MMSEEAEMRRLRRSSETDSKWEVETAASSHDSGYRSRYSSLSRYSWPVRAEAESEDLGLVKPRRDLLDSLILEDVKERLEMMKLEGFSLTELQCLDSLISGVERTGDRPCRPITGSGSSSPPVSVSPLCLNYSSQVTSVAKFMEQDIPLAFPGQLLPLNVKVPPLQHPPAVEVCHPSSFPPLQHPPVTAPPSLVFPAKPIDMSSSSALQSKPPAVKKGEGKPRVKISRREKKDDLSSAGKSRGPRSMQAQTGDRRRSSSEVAFHQLQALLRERSDLEQVLASNVQGYKVVHLERTVRPEVGEVEQLVQDVRDEQERIRGMVSRLETVTGLSQSNSLHLSIGRWEDVTRKLLYASRNSQNQASLALVMANMVTSIKRIRTLLWTITATKFSS